MDSVEWRHAAADNRALWVLALVGVGGLGSVVVLAAALAAWVLAAAVLDGDYAVVGVVALVLLAGARFVAAEAAVVVHEQFRLPGDVSNRAAAAASVAWAAVLTGLVALGAPSWVVAVPFVAMGVCVPLVAALSSEGRVDLDAGTATIRERDIPLDDVASVARYDIGPVALLWIRYHSRALGRPRVLGVGGADAAAVRAALTASDAIAPDADGQRLVAWTLYAFGGSALALAAWLGYVGVSSGGDAAAVGVYGAVFAGAFGLLFLWLGWTER